MALVAFMPHTSHIYAGVIINCRKLQNTAQHSYKVLYKSKNPVQKI